MKITFYGFIRRLISSPQPGEEAVNWKMSVESSQTEIHGEKKNKGKKNNIIQELWDNVKTCHVFVIRTPEEERTEQKKIFKAIMAENIPKSVEQRTADLGSSVNKKQDKCPKPNTHTTHTASAGISYLNCRKPKIENLERSWGGRGHRGTLTCKEQG